MGFFSLRQMAVTTGWGGGSVFSFGALFVQVATPAPQTTGRLFAVCPDEAELLTVVALGEGVLRSVGLHLYCNVAEAWQLENLLEFCRSRQGYLEKGKV
jgi:hypothetical protein